MREPRRKLAVVILAIACWGGPAFAELTGVETDFIAGQVRPAWLRIVEGKRAKAEPVTVTLSVRPDGVVDTARLATDEKRYDSDAQFRIVADAVVRAVLMASPLKVPPSNPEIFRNNPQLTITFDPRSMR